MSKASNIAVASILGGATSALKQAVQGRSQSPEGDKRAADFHRLLHGKGNAQNPSNTNSPKAFSGRASLHADKSMDREEISAERTGLSRPRAGVGSVDPDARTDDESPERVEDDPSSQDVSECVENFVLPALGANAETVPPVPKYSLQPEEGNLAAADSEERTNSIDPDRSSGASPGLFSAGQQGVGKDLGGASLGAASEAGSKQSFERVRPNLATQVRAYPIDSGLVSGTEAEIDEESAVGIADFQPSGDERLTSPPGKGPRGQSVNPLNSVAAGNRQSHLQVMPDDGYYFSGHLHSGSGEKLAELGALSLETVGGKITEKIDNEDFKLTEKPSGMLNAEGKAYPMPTTMSRASGGASEAPRTDAVHRVGIGHVVDEIAAIKEKLSISGSNRCVVDFEVEGQGKLQVEVTRRADHLEAIFRTDSQELRDTLRSAVSSADQMTSQVSFESVRKPTQSSGGFDLGGGQGWADSRGGPRTGQGICPAMR
jgi:hypothetical protein